MADSTPKSDSTATKGPATNSITTTTETALAADGHTCVDDPVGGHIPAARDTGDAQEAAPQATAADTDDGPVSPGGIRSNELAADSAGAAETVIQEAAPEAAPTSADAAGEEAEEAAPAEARKPGQSVLGPADAEAGKDAAETAANAEAEEDSKPAQEQSAKAAGRTDHADQVWCITRSHVVTCAQQRRWREGRGIEKLTPLQGPVSQSRLAAYIHCSLLKSRHTYLLVVLKQSACASVVFHHVQAGL